MKTFQLRKYFTVEKSKQVYPNNPSSLLPNWCKMRKDRPPWVIRKLAEWYFLFVSYDSGRSISDAIKPPEVSNTVFFIPPTSKKSLTVLQDSIEKKLVLLQKVYGERFEAELLKLSMQMEAKLKEQTKHIEELILHMSDKVCDEHTTFISMKHLAKDLAALACMQNGF